MKTKILIICIVGIFSFIQQLSGQTWEAEKRLTWTSTNSWYPVLDTDSNNNTHVVWHEETGSDEIYYKRSTNGGDTWLPAKRLTWNSGQSWSPIIAVDSSDHIHVIWYDYTPGASEIFYRKSTNGGATWLPSKRITWNLGGSQYPAIAIDSSDNIHVAWYDSSPGNYEIYYKRSTDSGTSWSKSKRLSWNSGNSWFPAVATGSSGQVCVVWYDWTPGNREIFHRRSTDGGVNWTSAKRLTWNSGNSEHPGIELDSSGNIHVVWYDETPGAAKIYYKRSTDGGATWITKRLSWATGGAWDPAVAIDSSNHLFVAWSQETTGGATEINIKKSTDGGSSWFSTKRLTWNSGLSDYPSIEIGPTGNIHLAWGDETPGNKEIYYKKGIQ